MQLIEQDLLRTILRLDLRHPVILDAPQAQLESDTRTLAFEAGRKWGVRVNTIRYFGLTQFFTILSLSL